MILVVSDAVVIGRHQFVNLDKIKNGKLWLDITLAFLNII